MSWTRRTRNYTIDGFSNPGGNVDVSSAPYVYKTDESLKYENPPVPASRFYIPKTDGNYHWRSTWSKVGGTPPSGNQAIETRVTVTNLGDDVIYCSSHRSGNVSTIDSLPFVDEAGGCMIWDVETDVYLVMKHTMLLSSFGQGYSETAELALAGDYQVNLIAPSGNSQLGTFEFRVLGTKIQHDGAAPPEPVDPNHPERHYTGARSYHCFSLAADSNWMPANNGLMRWTIMKGPHVAFRVEQQLPQQGGVGSSPHYDGYFAGVLSGWDGRDRTTGEYSVGLHEVKLAAILPVEGGVSTYSEKTDYIRVLPLKEFPPNEEEKRKREEASCNCTGSSVNYSGQSSDHNLISAGSSVGVSLVNRTAISLKDPSSLGYGWGLNRQERFEELPDYPNYVKHEYNSGQFNVWRRDGSEYIPARPENSTRRVDNTILTEDSNGSFLLTFQNKATKKFHPLNAAIAPGAIQWEKDRNGNATYFHYDSNGLLVALSDEVDGLGDPEGRVTRFDYQNPTSDPQPYKVISEVRANGALLGQQETTFAFYSATDESQGFLEGRISSVENPEGETQTFLYYADDQDFRFGRLFRILDARGNISKELDYHDDNHVRVKSETFYFDPGTGPTPELKREYSYGNIYGTVTGSTGSISRHQNHTMTMTSTDMTGRSAESNRTVKYTLNAARRPVKIEETVGLDTNLTTVEYISHLRSRVIDPNLKQERFFYNDESNTLNRTIDKLGREILFEYVPTDDYLIQKITLPEVTIPDPQNPGQTLTEQYETTFGYDAKGNLTSITDASNRTTYFRLRNGVDHPETDGQIWKVVNRRWDGNPSTENDHSTVLSYYDNGNLESIQTPAGPGSHPGTTTIFEYDVFDNLVKVTDSLGNEWKSVFDELGRVVETEDARGKKSYFDYADGLLVAAGAPPNLGPSGSQSFDIGNSRQARLTTFTHDYNGRVIKAESHTSSTTTEVRAEYEYTGFSELHKLTRLINGVNKTTEWSYDQLGRAVEMVDTLGRTLTRSYEPFCREFDQATARGILTKQTFDELCRPKLLITPDEELEHRYDELGRLVEVTRSLENRYGFAKYGSLESFIRSWTFEYDPLNRLTKAGDPNGQEISYLYGYEGELLKVTDPDGKVTKYEYNNDLSLKKVVLERGGVDVAEFVYSYDAGGRLEKILYPDGIEAHFNNGGTPAQSGWNANGQLTHLRYLKEDGGLQLIRSFQYDYDDSGNRIQAIESNGNASQNIEWQYRYDWFNRLVQVKMGVGGANPSLQREYVYDESNNRTYLDDYVSNRTLWYTYQTVGTGPATKYSDETKEVLSAVGTGKRAPQDLGDFTSLEQFSFDDDGNLVSRSNTTGTSSYEWSALNNLLKVTLDNNDKVTQNFYDFASIREEKVKDDGERVKSFSSGGATISESSDLNPSTSYFQGHQLMGFERNGNRFYYLTDGLSSVRSIVDSNGDEVAVYAHDEFGNELLTTGTLANPKTYVGGLGVHDDTADTRLLYMRRRHYDPTLGRFLSQDPIGLAGGLNLYEYAGANPVTYTDPLGMEPISIGASAGKGIPTLEDFIPESLWVKDYGHYSRAELEEALRDSPKCAIYYGHNYSGGLELEGGRVNINDILNGRPNYRNLPTITVFSGCNTANNDLKLPKNGRHAFVGFDRIIDGDLALQFTIGLYEGLMKGQTIEQAVQSGLTTASHSKRVTGHMDGPQVMDTLTKGLVLKGNPNARILR